MKFKQILDDVDNGSFVTVKFKKKIEEFDTVIDTGMVAEIRGWQNAKEEGVLQIFFDVGRHIDRNRRKMKPNYYDGRGDPCQTAEENGEWPSNGLVTVWFDEYDEPSDYFTVLSM